MKIVPYEERHRYFVERVCRSTFAWGDPVPVGIGDPFVSMVMRKHLDEGWGFVSESSGGINGYLLGVDPGGPSFAQKRAGFRILVNDFFRAYSGSECEGLRRFVEFTKQAIKSPPYRPNLPEVHLNLEEEARDGRVVRGLIGAWEDDLRERCIDGYWGGTWSNGDGSKERVLKRFGFDVVQVYGRNPFCEGGNLLIVRKMLSSANNA